MTSPWRPFVVPAFAVAGLALYLAVRAPEGTAAPVEAIVIATCSTNGEHSPCG
jgi:hypothetical protein